ncbi:RNA polymerase sigma factor [Paludisphaera rhizosphaerae]|uniref:RNA polymerase sigma factor n=1 Tax=Paludisphaera rhizosphaerae TaxID=2711216 RepID=UPI0013EA1281|nr:RNA polymerase sigma factor [Paludisphaera rhizosphaerae]
MSASLVGGEARFARGAERLDDVEASDGELLRRFLAHRDQAAFERLVVRHGPKVLRVCRRWSGPGQDAEDAYQATFLLLATRAEAIRRPEHLGAWLCGVARRVASRAKRRADLRHRREGASIDLSVVADRSRPSPLDDLRPDLRATIERMPEKYRRPIELCYWDGLSSEQAAARLRCPTGTLKWRLSQAREDLRDRLGRAGIGLAALLVWLGRPSAARAESIAEAEEHLRLAADAVDLAVRFHGDASPVPTAENVDLFVRPIHDGPPPTARPRWRMRRMRKAVPLIVVTAAALAYLSWSSPTLARVADLISAALTPTPTQGCH